MISLGGAALTSLKEALVMMTSLATPELIPYTVERAMMTSLGIRVLTSSRAAQVVTTSEAAKGMTFSLVVAVLIPRMEVQAMIPLTSVTLAWESWLI